jgi:hypothetical protein
MYLSDLEASNNNKPATSAMADESKKGANGSEYIAAIIEQNKMAIDTINRFLLSIFDIILRFMILSIENFQHDLIMFTHGINIYT